MSSHTTEPEEVDLGYPAEGSPIDPRSAQVDGEGKEMPPSLPDGPPEATAGPLVGPGRNGGQGVTIAHVHGGGKPGEWRHGAYTLLGGGLDGRHRLERAVRRLCEELARDQGFASFAALPATRRGLTRRHAEIDVAASTMWASGVTTGRLADRWLDLVNAQNRLAQALGLQRVLKPANVVTLDQIRARYDGQEANR